MWMSPLWGFYMVCGKASGVPRRGCYLHSLALEVQAIFAGHLVEVVIFQEGLLHYPSGKQGEELKNKGEKGHPFTI